MNYAQYLMELSESPQLIMPTEFGLDDLNNNKRITGSLLAKSDLFKFSSKFKGESSLYKTGNKIFLERKGITYYLVQYEINYVPQLKHNAVTQVKVWRGRGKNFANRDVINMSTNIFFNHLIELEGILVTDSMQTDDGEAFWSDRIAQAFDLGYYVYYMNMLAPNKEILRIENEDSFNQITKEKDIWGLKEKHKARRVVISKTPLD